MFEPRQKIHERRARDAQYDPCDLLRALFAPLLDQFTIVDAQFVDATRQTVLGIGALPFQAPVVATILKDAEVFRYLQRFWHDGQSILLLSKTTRGPVGLYVKGERLERVADAPPGFTEKVEAVLQSVPGWAGYLNEEGHHVIELRSPSPGPHFFVNALLGNRIGCAKPLQTTPKSVVDRLGRGSFRSHAATQVLATRWDMRPEENGFPANRQFYLVENGRQIFYSADPNDENILSAQAIHAPNRTVITYRTRCGLEVSRKIFLLPYVEGLPIATEVQSITVTNHSHTPRRLRLVTTGMLGAAAPGALQQDVVYTTVSMQARVFQRDDGSIVAVSPHYHPLWAREDVRFHSTVLHQGDKTYFPTEFCTSYNEFVGGGTLERPEGLLLLSNKVARKGPGFFALAADMVIPPGQKARADNFTGLVSGVTDPHFRDEDLAEQVQNLLTRYACLEEVDRALAANMAFLSRYTRYLRVESGDALFDRYVNQNLPFQILYQTFVSRSFDQTQKGHREIGFREIQDLFASMPLFIAMGHQQFVKDLLKEWASQVFEFGYAYHNFYWTGKEPGDFSDDGLWLAQAVDIYLNQTGDLSFLDELCDVAATEPIRRRTIYETIQAVLRYSGEISIGKHGLPLLDGADWNDTLRLDPDYLNGPHKEEAYRTQVSAGGQEGEPFQSNYSESVMNAFLLKIALDATQRMAERKGDLVYASRLQMLAQRLRDNLQRHAWHDDYFARVLINRFPDGRYAYLGAKGDGLSGDPNLDGTYFLNSFTWSILAGIATEEQIRTMLDVTKRVLLTPHGLKLCSPVKYDGLMAERGGSGEYFLGDRENGGVFKHADMMAAVAMLKAAREVADRALAAELAGLAYRVIDAVLPYRTMRDPYVLAGNPRFCTQYNNGDTGENVGPTLSGTATWLWLALTTAYGIGVSLEGIDLDPILREDQEECTLVLNTGSAAYQVRISKPKGFQRTRDQAPLVSVDGKLWPTSRIPHFADDDMHVVELRFEPAPQVVEQLRVPAEFDAPTDFQQ